MSVLCRKIEPNNDIDKLLLDTFTNRLRPGYVEVGEEKICMPMIYGTIADRINNFEVRDTDVFIATHPKSGTTWTLEMVWMILNDMEKNEIENKFILERSPFLEFECVYDYRDVLAKDPSISLHPWLVDSINFAANCENKPRIIKTHLPWSLLPKQIRERTKTPKIIHVLRNPKDTCVSYYYHCRLLEGFQQDFNTFHKLFLAGRLNDGPFWQNVLGYWHKRNDPNILVIRFEDMKRDLPSVVRRVATFLGKKCNEEKLPALVEHLSFENMKQNPALKCDINEINEPFIHNQIGEFMRSGTVNGYLTEMSPDIIKVFDQWTAEHTRGTGLTFDL